MIKINILKSCRILNVSIKDLRLLVSGNEETLSKSDMSSVVHKPSKLYVGKEIPEAGKELGAHTSLFAQGCPGLWQLSQCSD